MLLLNEVQSCKAVSWSSLWHVVAVALLHDAESMFRGSCDQIQVVAAVWVDEAVTKLILLLQSRLRSALETLDNNEERAVLEHQIAEAQAQLAQLSDSADAVVDALQIAQAAEFGQGAEAVEAAFQADQDGEPYKPCNKALSDKRLELDHILDLCISLGAHSMAVVGLNVQCACCSRDHA